MRPETHSNIDSFVDEELRNATLTTSNLDFFTHKIPEEELPCSPKEMLDALSTDFSDELPALYNLGESRWSHWPQTHVPSRNGDIERLLAPYLNGIATALMARLEGKGVRQPRFLWDGTSAAKGIKAHRSTRKPDLLVRDFIDVAHKAKGTDWNCVRSVLELKSNTKGRAQAFKQACSSARLIFGQQANRRFVLTISLLGTTMSLTVFNRSGAITSASFDVHEQPELFLRVAIGILFLPDAYLGYDQTVDLINNEIYVKGMKYQIDSIIYQEPSLRGRGTICFKVYVNGKLYVIKDSWVDMSRAVKEWELLDEIKGIANVAEVIDHEVVQIGNDEDSTARDLNLVTTSHNVEIRNHVRMVISPYGSHIYQFRSKKELLHAFIDVIKAHRDMYHDKGILHRDISLRNILLSEDEDQSAEGCRAGLLIDLDFAIKMSDISRLLAKGVRTGTLPFMAAAILMEKKTHDADHDLESFFYAFCWICITREGPGRSRKGFKFERSSLTLWSGEPHDTPYQMGFKKLGTVLSASTFEDTVIADFHPYFGGLRLCASELRDVLFRDYDTRKACLHDDVIAVFEKALQGITDEDPPPSGPSVGTESTEAGQSVEDHGDVHDKHLTKAKSLAKPSGTDPMLKRKRMPLPNLHEDEEANPEGKDDEVECQQGSDGEDLFGTSSPKGGLPKSVGSLRRSDYTSGGSSNKRHRH